MAVSVRDLRARLEKLDTLRKIEVERWGFPVFYRPLSLAKQAEIETRFDGRPPAETLAGFVILNARDEAGEPLFADNVESLAFLQSEPASLIAGLCRKMKADISEAEAGNG